MTPSPFDLQGKVAFVTGSTRGIGKSIAEAMARAGAKVVVSSRKAEACEAVRADFERQGWPVIDVTRRSIEETAAAVLGLVAEKRQKEPTELNA